jgi:hypothetical protein
LLLAQPLGAQTSAERLAIARRHIAALQYDSARAALRPVIDTASRESAEVRAEGFVLLAIIEDRQGNLPAARQALQDALRVKPDLKVEGLEQVAPMVAPYFEVERCRVQGGGALGCDDVAAADGRERPATVPFQDCLRRCPDGVTKPVLQQLPDIGRHLPPVQMGPSGVRGQVTLEFVVGPEGFVDQGTARVTSSTIRAYEDFLMNRLSTARFRPAISVDGPVPARIRMRFDFRATGLDRITYTVRVL